MEFCTDTMIYIYLYTYINLYICRSLRYPFQLTRDDPSARDDCFVIGEREVLANLGIKTSKNRVAIAVAEHLELL